jgi:sodium-dependent phosphate transporter
MVLTEYTYVFALGTCFALLEAYNNGASTSKSLQLLK